jgi:hypothetical protein
MSDVRKLGWADTLPDLGASFAQAGSDATRRFCEQGEAVAKTISEWNAEISQFVSHRATRNGETMGRITKCQNLLEVCTVQAQWLQDATDDYLKEMGKLIEVNSRLMGGLLPTVGQGEMRQSAETPSPQTPSPQTTSPQTPSPQTPSPQTPSPQTTSPQTPSPQIRAPVRSREQTASESASQASAS